MFQLQMFETQDTEKLREELQRVRESNDKMRKALFARHGELNKHYLDLLNRLEVIEKGICTSIEK